MDAALHVLQLSVIDAKHAKSTIEAIVKDALVAQVEYLRVGSDVALRLLQAHRPPVEAGLCWRLLLAESCAIFPPDAALCRGFHEPGQGGTHLVLCVMEGNHPVTPEQHQA